MSLHAHLDADNYLEIIAVQGETEDIRTLTQKLKTSKGIKQVQLAIVTPQRNDDIGLYYGSMRASEHVFLKALHWGSSQELQRNLMIQKLARDGN